MNKKIRLSYIDVLKGIMILMVVIGHIKLYYYQISDEPNIVVNGIEKGNNFWALFYMNAFFIVTGYCSGFKKNIREFIFANFKSTIIPACSICLISSFVSYTLGIGSLLGSIARPCISILLYGGGFWFLSAIFIAKIIVWFTVNKISSPKQQFIGLSLLSIIGYSILQYTNVPSYWFVFQAFYYAIYILIGLYLKNVNINKLVCIMGGGIIHLPFCWINILRNATYCTVPSHAF